MKYRSEIKIKIPNIKVSISSICLRAGARYTDKNLEGLPHLIEHLFLGSQTQTKHDLLGVLGKKGFIYNARTGRELLNFYIISKPGKEDEAINFLTKQLKAIKVDQDRLLQEKEIIKSEIVTTDPTYSLIEKAYEAMWENTALGNKVLGTTSSVNNMTTDKLENFIYGILLKQTPTVITITPNQNEETNLISQTTNELKPTMRKSIVSDTSTIIASFALPHLDNNQQKALGLISLALAGSWNSLLINELRHQRNIAYWANYRTSFHSDSTSLNFIVKTNSLHKSEATEIIKATLFNPDTYSNKITEYIKQVAPTYEIRESIRLSNPMEYFERVVQLVSSNSISTSTTLFSSIIPSEESIDNILNLLTTITS